MKFTVSSSLLNQRLQSIRGVIGGKSTISILDSFLFEFNGLKLTLTASDGDNRLTTTVELNDIDVDAARICINAKTILDTLKELADQPLTFTIDLERNTVKGNYSNGEFNITCQSANDYPIPATIEGDKQVVTMPSSSLLMGLTRCSGCTKEDDMHPVMNGVFFNATTDKTIFVATDGHRLMRISTFKSHTSSAYSVVIPKKSIILLRNILTKDDAEVQVTTTDKMLEVKTKDFLLIGKLIDSKYPQYETVIPMNNPHHIIIDRQSLLSATKRVVLFSSQSSSLVKLRFENDMCTIFGQDYEFATSAEERIACQYTGPVVTIGFKGNLLSDMLNFVDCAEVRLELADPSKPGLIIPTEMPDGEDILMLLMPMMVKE